MVLPIRNSSPLELQIFSKCSLDSNVTKRYQLYDAFGLMLLFTKMLYILADKLFVSPLGGLLVDIPQKTVLKGLNCDNKAYWRHHLISISAFAL